MKLNRLLTLCCALSMALGMVTFASAAEDRKSTRLNSSH